MTITATRFALRPRGRERALDAFAEQGPVRETGQRVVPRLVLVQGGLRHERLLGALALGHVLDHHDRQGGLVVGVEDERHRAVHPQHVAVLAEDPMLERRRAVASGAPPIQVEHRLAVLRVHVVDGERAGELLLGVAHQRLERRVRVHDPALGVERHDPGERARVSGLEAREHLDLALLGVELCGAAERRGQHHRQQLERAAVVLAEARAVRGRHDVQAPTGRSAWNSGTQMWDWSRIDCANSL